MTGPGNCGRWDYRQRSVLVHGQPMRVFQADDTSVAFPCPTWSNESKEVKMDAPMTMDMPVSMRSTMAVEEEDDDDDDDD
jgi:hypothetical protein